MLISGSLWCSSQWAAFPSDANGLLENARMDAREGCVNFAQLAGKIPAELNKAVPLRSISLRRLNEAIEECLTTGKPISEEMAFLGGLQQIRYVFVYPEQKDIVLVGQAEGWKMDAHGNVVGATTGRSVMFLDDLAVALRTGAGSDRAGSPAQSIRPPKACSSCGRMWLSCMLSVIGMHGHGHRAGPRAAADHRDRGSRYQPLRRGTGGGRLPHEAARHEIRSHAGPGHAKLFGHA